MADDNEFTDVEKRQIINRALALSMTILNAGTELRDLLTSVREQKVVTKREVDEFGDPTYRFKVKVGIPQGILLTRKMKDYALSKGFNASTLQPVWEEFNNYYRRTGTKWQDWTAVWQKWVRTELERRASKSSGSSRDLTEL